MSVTGLAVIQECDAKLVECSLKFSWSYYEQSELDRIKWISSRATVFFCIGSIPSLF